MSFSLAEAMEVIRAVKEWGEAHPTDENREAAWTAQHVILTAAEWKFEKWIERHEQWIRDRTR